MKQKMYIVYDERARVTELDECAILFSTQDKKEALEYANENNGVVEENDFDGETAENGVIIN